MLGIAVSHITLSKILRLCSFILNSHLSLIHMVLQVETIKVNQNFDAKNGAKKGGADEE